MLCAARWRKARLSLWGPGPTEERFAHARLEQSAMARPGRMPEKNAREYARNDARIFAKQDARKPEYAR